MNESLVGWLRCPACAGKLSLEDAKCAESEIESGSLECIACRERYSIHESIPRFVPPSNYAESFGLQWNRFRRTQLDSHSGRTISRDRFLMSTHWRPESLAGKTVLDVGCGAGRFAEVALSCGATVFAVDYSRAVDACRSNFPGHPRLYVVQGDIYALPFPTEAFDFVYCLGVLQHTPDPQRAFLSLPRHLKPGGQLAVDVYQGGWRRVLHTKYWVRPLTTRLSAGRLFAGVTRWMPFLLRLSRGIGRIPVIGSRAKRLLPIANYDGLYGLDATQLTEWAVLDTFDMLAPAYDRPQTPRALHDWTRQANLAEVEIGRFGHLVARGRKAA